jgi:hypothetical protein
MNRIYKYPLTLTVSQCVKMPTHARILSFQMQDGTPTIWAVVTPTATVVNREFRIAGTGHEVPPGDFVGTVQDGAYVWHLFDNGESPASESE